MNPRLANSTTENWRPRRGKLGASPDDGAAPEKSIRLQPRRRRSSEGPAPSGPFGGRLSILALGEAATERSPPDDGDQVLKLYIDPVNPSTDG